MRLSKPFVIGFLFILVLILSLVSCAPVDHSNGWAISSIFMVIILMLMVLVPVAIVILIIWFWKRRPQGQPPGQNKDHKYLDIAKQRYAKGEITQEQYEQIKKAFS